MRRWREPCRGADESHDSHLIFNPGGSHESDSPNHPGFMTLTLQGPRIHQESWESLCGLRLEKSEFGVEKISSEEGKGV